MSFDHMPEELVDGWRCLPRSTTRGGDGVVGGPLLRTSHGGLIGLACDVPESCWRCGAALLRCRWCELTAPWRELIAAGTSWRELLQDLELRLDLDLGSDDDSEDREYVRGLFEAEYAEAMSYEGHD